MNFEFGIDRRFVALSLVHYKLKNLTHWLLFVLCYIICTNCEQTKKNQNTPHFPFQLCGRYATPAFPITLYKFQNQKHSTHGVHQMVFIFNNLLNSDRIV